MDERAKGKTLSALKEAELCHKKRAFKYDPHVTDQKENYSRSIIAKATIRAALIYKERDPKAIMEYMMSRYKECGFKNFQQKQAQLLWDHWRVMRLLRDIPTDANVIFPKADTVKIGNTEYEAKCDFALATGKTIEFVVIRIGKPDTTRKGKKGAYARDMKLFALILLGRKLGYQTIQASFYFLKKTTDRQSRGQCEQHFYGANVVSLNDFWQGKPNMLDDQMKDLIERHDEGLEPEEMKEEDCENCECKSICKYELPPLRADAVEAVEEKASAATAVVSYTDDQLEAINAREGVIRIIAGAGSGKTKVVVERALRMLEEGVKPEELCLITFTKAAAEEMLRRLEKEVGHSLPGITISTINAFENEIVKREYKRIGYKRPQKVIDSVEQFSIIAELLNKNPILEWSGKAFLNFSATQIFGQQGALLIAANVFSACKKSGKEPGKITAYDVLHAVNPEEISITALTKLVKLYEQYDRMLRENGLIDFDDQEILTFKVLEMDPDYLAKHYRFKHVVVDEFQDTSLGQIQLIKKLIEIPTCESLMVVGDDSQSIYGFRDTSPTFLVEFEKFIGRPVRDIVLDKNFRSTPEIVGFANEVNALNENRVMKNLVATRPGGKKVVVKGFEKKEDELDFICKGVAEHLAKGVTPTILARTKDELKSIADALTKRGIPSMFCAPEPMKKNDRILAILAFARVLQDNTDTKDALICANALRGGGIMELSLSEIEQEVAAVLDRGAEIRAAYDEKKKELFLSFIDDVCMDDEVVEHFKESFEFKDYEECLEYCRAFDMYGDGVEYRRTAKYPGVLLVTAHSSKGLEYPVVYNTITKYQTHARMGLDEMEETRRLLFVSATRARDELIITGLYNNGTKGNPFGNVFLHEAIAIAGDKKTTPDQLRLAV